MPFSGSAFLYWHQGWLLSRNPAWESSKGGQKPKAPRLLCMICFLLLSLTIHWRSAWRALEGASSIKPMG